MLEYTPLHLQVLLWPLLGAAITVPFGRVLPDWLSRLAALSASVASLAALWALRASSAAPVQYDWEPFTLFRMGPALYVDPLSLLSALTLAGVTAALVLGIRGSSVRSTWQGWILVTLTGGLLMVMAANLLTVALGSALVDLSLVVRAVSGSDSTESSQRTAWRMCVPGMAATLLVFLAALKMDADVGTASLLARQMPSEILVLTGAAALLRMLVFPLHARGLQVPEPGALWLVSVGAGCYLLARVQGLGAGLALPGVVVLAAAGLLAGGVMAWVGCHHPTQRSPAEAWTGLAVHQTGLALIYALLLPAAAPWTLPSLLLALGILLLWWSGRRERPAAVWPVWMRWLQRAAQKRLARARSWIEERAPVLVRWRRSWAAQHGVSALPVFAVASVLGLPFTAGAGVRWHVYGAALGQGRAAVLLAALVADCLLAGGLWALARKLVRQAGEQRPTPSATLAMVVLAAGVLGLGIALRRVADSLGVSPFEPSGVSRWGLGLLYVLPWLVGAWLARASRQIGGLVARVRRDMGQDRWFRGLALVGDRAAAAVYWLGSVGEGEGWWGWALIILALGALFLTGR